MNNLLRRLIKAYSFALSPLLGRHCRFHPTCSAYADQAIARHGALKGLWLTLKRLGKCHPYYRGGHDDPVPD